MGELMRLTYTYDGDTLGALDAAGQAVRIRLAWIEAPELEQERWGIRARAYLRSLLAIGERLDVNVIGDDDYGRLVAEVLRARDYGNCGLRLVLGGYAAVRHCPNNQPAYRAAQDIAQRDRRGIWAQPGPHQTPWLYR